MELTAIYRVESGSSLTHRKDDFYSSKKQYARELRSNGFKVLVIYSNEELEKIIKEPPNTADPIHKDYVKQVITNEESLIK